MLGFEQKIIVLQWKLEDTVIPLLTTHLSELCDKYEVENELIYSFLANNIEIIETLSFITYELLQFLIYTNHTKRICQKEVV